jgi:hypothetical protein
VRIYSINGIKNEFVYAECTVYNHALQRVAFCHGNGFGIADLEGTPVRVDLGWCHWPAFTDNPHVMELSSLSAQGATFLHDLRMSTERALSYPLYSTPAQSISLPAPRWVEQQRGEKSTELCRLDWRAAPVSAGRITSGLNLSSLTRRASMVL